MSEPGVMREASGDEPELPLFLRGWWLDAVAPGRWREVAVRSGDEVTARLRFVTTRRFGLTICGMPPLTPCLGPWFSPTSASPAKALSRTQSLLAGLIALLPRCDAFTHRLRPEQEDWLPFHWAGFDSGVRTTFRIEDLSDPDRVFAGMRDSARRQIRKAEKTVEVHEEDDLEAFLDLQEKTFDRQEMANPINRETVARIDSACASRDRRRILVARDAAGRAHAGAYVVRDERVSYYLMGGGDPSLRDSGGGQLVLWDAIRRAAETTEIFDFEGSMIEPVNRFFRGFGARPRNYIEVRRWNRKYRLLRAISRRARR